MPSLNDKRRPAIPAIPADLKRKVLVEAGHRCAIPTCRHIEVEVHHIIPWAERNEHTYENLIALCPNCHSLADKNKIDRKSLRLYKLNLCTIHDKYSQLEIDVLFKANRIPRGQVIQWPPFMNILIQRIVEAGFVTLSQGGRGVSAGGMQINPLDLTITQEGRDYIQRIDKEEI